jgi:hypothetical protein
MSFERLLNLLQHRIFFTATYLRDVELRVFGHPTNVLGELQQPFNARDRRMKQAGFSEKNSSSSLDNPFDVSCYSIYCSYSKLSFKYTSSGAFLLAGLLSFERANEMFSSIGNNIMKVHFSFFFF